MKTLSAAQNFNEGINFNFNTTYLGNDITLRVSANNGLYCISHNGKPIGNIKLGEISHTWYVVDKNYVPSYLTDVIGNKIAAQL